MGVSFFYIVSGFVLTWTARPGDRPREFYQRRFARIYPLYVVCWLMQGHRLGWVEFVPLTLLQSWVPDATIYFAVSAVFWSLSCEAFFYLVFPWLFPALRRLATRGRMMLALQLRRNDTFRFPLWAAILIATVAFFADAFAPGSYQRVAVMVIPFALVVWSAARADLHGHWSPFRGRIVVTLGVWSYAFYLIHAEVIVVWLTALGKLGVREQDLTGVTLALVFVGAFVLSIVAAGILHTLVEAPLERVLRPNGRGADRRANAPPLALPREGDA